MTQFIGTGEDIAILDLKDGSEPFPVAKTPFVEDSPHFSRDSAWLAYRSYASGRSEIYVQRVADASGRVKVSANGGATPRWSPTNDELYYVAGDMIVALGYRIVGGEFHGETPRALVKLPESHSRLTRGDALGATLEVSPDGKRFLLAVETGEDPSPTELHIKTNWFQELKRLTAVSGFEIVSFTNGAGFGNFDVDMDLITDAVVFSMSDTSAIADLSGASITLNDAPADIHLYFFGQGKSTSAGSHNGVTVNLKDDSGTSDSLTLSFSNLGVDAGLKNQAVGAITAQDIESLSKTS